MHLEIPHSKGEKPARKTRAGSPLRNELSAAYAKRNLRRVDFRRHHRGCRHRHHHLGCLRHHRGCLRHRRNFGLVRNRNGTAPDSSGPAENTFVARRTSSILSTRARAVDYTSEPAADCRSAAAKNHDYRGTPASRDSSVAVARKHGRCLRSSDDCHCYSEATRCAGQSYSRWNRNGQPTGDDPRGACVLIAVIDSRDDSTLRILSVRGPGRSHRAVLPKYAS